MQEYNGRDYDDRRYESDDDHRRNRQKGAPNAIARCTQHNENSLCVSQDSVQGGLQVECNPHS